MRKKTTVIESGSDVLSSALRLRAKWYKIILLGKHNDLSSNYDMDSAILKVIFIRLASLTFPHILLEYIIKKKWKINLKFF